ncbi:unnamed protein product [Phytophthora fragariaefolia]|uniref:Unnamed protein product n=1 Tax=Phytophthora fragariaefolia TaxID=1490495 RepID=A0A9W6YQZ1_9STRA|nr:unnamed protein product [Phytophthora fragariaefolia]
MVGSRQWSHGAEFSTSFFAAELGCADFQYVGCWVGYDSRRLPSAVGGASSSPWESIPPRPLDPGDPAVGSRLSVESRSLLGVCSIGCLCHKLGGFGVLHGCDFSAGIDGSTSSRCSRWLGEFYPSSTRRTSPQAAKASAGSTSKSARKSPAKAAAGSSRRAPRNSAASPKSTSIVAPAPSITGSTRSQRASALNARAINNVELQALEASDAEVLGWSSGATNSAARATSASSPLVVDSPSPLVVTPTPAPVGASSSQRQSSSDDSADDDVALQRSRRVRKKSLVESDESSDSVAEALEEKPASPLTPASVPPTPSTGQKRPSSPVTPASTKKARASASAPSSSPPRPVAKSTSRVRPTAKSSKAAKLATKTARGTAKSGKSAKSADPPVPASGQSASASGTAAVSAPTSSASSGQAPNSAGGGATSLPDVLCLPILTLRTRAAQAVSRDSRVPDQTKIWRDPPFFHLGSARCWDQVMGGCVVEIQKEIVDGKPRVRSTPSSLSGLTAFADVPAIVLQVGSARRDRGGVLAQVPWRSPRNGQGVRRPLRAHALARRFKRRSRSPPRPEPDELG